METKSPLTDYITLLIIFSLVLAIPIFVWALLTQRFNIQKKAQLDTEYGLLLLNPSEAQGYQDDILPVNIMVDTAGNSISAISIRISYSYSGDAPELVPADQLGNELSSLILNQDLLLSGTWSFPVNQITHSNNQVIIEMAAINTSTSGFRSTEPMILANFYLRADKITESPIKINIDKSLSMMMTKTSPVINILDPSEESAIYSISIDSAPPYGITDLTTTNISYNSLNLVWTAPNDPGPENSFVESYQIRSSSENISDANWNNAQVVENILVPKSSGQQETLAINDLNSNQIYYFAVKSTDNNQNISNLSNLASATTLPSNLSATLSLQGTNSAGLVQNITLSVEGDFNSSQSLSFRSNSDGNFHTQTPFSFEEMQIPNSGISFNFFAKTNSHLRKNLGLLNILPGDNQSPLSWTHAELLAGDFNADNLLNISDIGLILSVYTRLSVPVDASNQIFDVDLNKVINISDIALVLSNYTQLQVNGD